MRRTALIATSLVISFSSNVAWAQLLLVQQGSLSGNPAIAWSGSQYLVSWTDTRADGADIFASRVTADGVVLDPAGIPISTIAGSYEGGPAIATNGQDFLIAWTDFRDTSPRIRATRVRADGTVLDTAAILVSGGPGSQASPTVTWAGDHYLVAWDDQRNGTYFVSMVRLDPNGLVGTVVDVVLPHGGAVERWPTLASTGGQSLLAVGGPSGELATLPVFVDGSIGAVSIVAPQSNSVPRLVARDGDYQIVWGVVGATSTEILVTTIDANGIAVSAAQTVALLANVTYPDPVIGFDGDHTTVAWSDGFSVEGRVLGCDPGAFSATTNASRPAIAGGDTLLLVSAGPTGVTGLYVETCCPDQDEDNDDRGDDDDHGDNDDRRDDHDDGGDIDDRGDDDDHDDNGDHDEDHGNRAFRLQISDATPSGSFGCRVSTEAAGPSVAWASPFALAFLVVALRRRR